ncbi:arylformamidase [Aquibacillus kalidii]|uniref:arylformamidase n=1 Tax=Aquibacillus kalidii TaxID=2762597 RepID=UPI00164466E3|nr:arylformamidase [Aquibacillus kalidii]
MSKWIDISQPLTDDIAHWPEDQPFSYKTTYTKQETGSANIGQMTGSLHLGTHVDAPFHFENNGEKIIAVDVDVYIGESIVLDVSHTSIIKASTLQEFDLEGVERVLLRTSLPSNPKQFPEEIPVLDPDIAPFLAEKGVKLLGVNMPSVDPLDSKDLFTHHALYDNGIYILENLVLEHVDEGAYFLSALPLNIVEGDGSPVRAVIKRL